MIDVSQEFFQEQLTSLSEGVSVSSIEMSLLDSSRRRYLQALTSVDMLLSIKVSSSAELDYVADIVFSSVQNVRLQLLGILQTEISSNISGLTFTLLENYSGASSTQPTIAPSSIPSVSSLPSSTPSISPSTEKTVVSATALAAVSGGAAAAASSVSGTEKYSCSSFYDTNLINLFLPTLGSGIIIGCSKCWG